MPRPAIVTEKMRARFEEVARKRFDTPTDKELADEARCSVATVRWYMRRFLSEMTVSLETTSAKIARTPLSQATDAPRATAECR